MKSSEAWIEMECRDGPEDPAGFRLHTRFREDASIEQARKFLEQAMTYRVLDSTEYRIVYVRVETTREVLD